jgi:molecular chaperone GrpE
MTHTTPDSKLDRAEESDRGQPMEVKIHNNDEAIRVTDRRFWVQPEQGQEARPTEYSFKPTYVEELERRLADSQKKLDEVLASYREFKAESAGESQRSRERIQNEYNRRLDQAKSEVLKKFVDVLENLERALAAAQDRPAFEALLDGVQLIRNQFVTVLSDLGVTELELTGEPFNPEVAEAVGVVDVSGEDQDQRVVEVVSKGYLLKDSLVRPARVKVGRRRADAAESSV